MTLTTIAPPDASRAEGEARPRSFNVEVYGADGMSGRELCRLLHMHPRIHRVREITRDGQVLSGWADPWDQPEAERGTRACAEVAFVCLARADARDVIPRCLVAGTRVIDLSGLLHERDPALTRGRAVTYGLPELLQERLQQAQLVASPRSHATAATLALAPAAQAGVLASLVELELLSGEEGTPQDHDPLERQLEEIRTTLTELNRTGIPLRVQAHGRTEPREHGLVLTARFRSQGVSLPRLLTLYRTWYAEAPCVRVLTRGLPTLPEVQGTNLAALGLRQVGEELEVVCALDDQLQCSLTRAVRAMNLSLGLPEELGLLGYAPHALAAAGPARRPDL